MVREAVDALEAADAAAAAPPRKRAAAKKAARKAPAKKAARKAVAAPPPPPPEDPWAAARHAHESIIAGGGWEQVAGDFGYPSIEAATLDVQAYLAYVHVMTGDDERTAAKRLELERLEAMWRHWWQLGSEMKDKDAALVLLRISERRAKLLELETLNQRADSTQTIIITGGAGMADELRAEAVRLVPALAAAPRVAGAPPQDEVVAIHTLD